MATESVAIEPVTMLPLELRPDVEHLTTEDDTPVDSLFSEQQQLLTDPLYASWPGPGTDRPFLTGRERAEQAEAHAEQALYRTRSTLARLTRSQRRRRFCACRTRRRRWLRVKRQPELCLKLNKTGVHIGYRSARGAKFFGTQIRPKRGDQPLLREAIDRDGLGDMVESISAGGGGLNLALVLADLARRLGLDVEIVFIDSSARCPEVARVCRRARIRLISASAMRTPLNAIVPYAPDKVCLRSPFQFLRARPAASVRSAINRVLTGAALVAVLSPKAVPVPRLLFASAAGAARILRPGGSLPPAEIRALCPVAAAVVFNFIEFGPLVSGCGLEWPDDAAEDCPEAPAQAIVGLHPLQRQGLFAKGRRRMGRRMSRNRVSPNHASSPNLASWGA